LRPTYLRVITRSLKFCVASSQGRAREPAFFLSGEISSQHNRNQDETPMRKDIQDLWTLAEPYVNDAGFDLVEVQSGREPTGWVVRLFIDVLREGQVPVSHADCERVSRDLSAALDVADAIPHAYQLEVSSPGLDRPLRRERDFARFAGQSARVKLADGVEGRRNFSGTIRGAQAGTVEIECEGRSYQLPIDQVVKAHLVPDWEREFHRSAS
jgi:ribosome maturation factor RimP